MGDEVEVTIEDQFYAFARLNDNKRSGETITLYRSDYWMRQARILDDRNVTMGDTGNLFFGKYSKTEINYQEWMDFVLDLCALKGLDEEGILNRLTVCGLPGDTAVVIPEFRTYFNTWESKREIYCNATYDGFLCWPPTLSGEVATQHCPKEHFSDPAYFAVKKCGEYGRWNGRDPNDTNPNGWTNYTSCFPPVVQTLFKQLHEGDAQHKFQIADNTRTIEIVGFSISLVSLIISLIILHKYETLHNLRTSIHKNLFWAMSLQVIARLIVYVDQAMMRRGAGSSSYTGISAIESIPMLCICTYITLEYLSCVMFLWMLCEGVYLNTIVTSNVLRDNIQVYKYFCVLGWISPLLITAIWAVIAGIKYSQDPASSGCWYGYNFQSYFWVIQGPRLAVILINFGFLLNIMRVLILKLREDTTSDIVKARKAVKAAMVLLPLLGITNILSMFEGPVSGPEWHFATWSYITHTLRSGQGAVLAWLYCLGTAEVRVILKREFNNRLSIFRYRHPRLASCLGIARRRPIQRFPRNAPRQLPEHMRPGDYPLRPLRNFREVQLVGVPNFAETGFGGNNNRRMGDGQSRQQSRFQPPPQPSGSGTSHRGSAGDMRPGGYHSRQLRHFRPQTENPVPPPSNVAEMEPVQPTEVTTVRRPGEITKRYLRLFRKPSTSGTDPRQVTIDMPPDDGPKGPQKQPLVPQPSTSGTDPGQMTIDKLKPDDEPKKHRKVFRIRPPLPKLSPPDPKVTIEGPPRVAVVRFKQVVEVCEIHSEPDGDIRRTLPYYVQLKESVETVKVPIKKPEDGTSTSLQPPTPVSLEEFMKACEIPHETPEGDSSKTHRPPAAVHFKPTVEVCEFPREHTEGDNLLLRSLPKYTALKESVEATVILSDSSDDESSSNDSPFALIPFMDHVEACETSGESSDDSSTMDRPPTPLRESIGVCEIHYESSAGQSSTTYRQPLKVHLKENTEVIDIPSDDDESSSI